LGSPKLVTINSRWRTAAILDFPQNAVTKHPVEIYLCKLVRISTATTGKWSWYKQNWHRM